MTAATPGQTGFRDVPPVFARWCRADDASMSDYAILTAWRAASPGRRTFWTEDGALAAQERQPASGVGAAVANAALQKAVDARRDHEAGRAAAARIMNLVPLGRHASPDECEQIRRELRAIVTGREPS